MIQKPTVVIFGAGISGLTTAHYLSENYNVTIIESLSVPGGLARSERIPEDKGIPSEYSWRGFGPWYHNTFDVMKEIPVLPNGTVYSQELSRPINFIFTPDEYVPLEKINNFGADSLRLSFLDKIKLGWMTLKTWTASDNRSEDIYASKLASEWLNENLSKDGASTLGSIFGPWVGVDASRASVHHVSRFFRKNVFPGEPGPYYHEAIPRNSNTGQLERPEFTQGGSSRWLILRRPSNEAWFDPWVDNLKNKGVKFIFNCSLKRLVYRNKKIDHVIVNTKGKEHSIKTDYYVLAINPYETRDIISKDREILKDPQLSTFEKLCSGAPHTQISFRIAFSSKVSLPGIETAIILVDSEFHITFFSQDQLFHPDVNLGKDIKSLWSGTATIDNKKGQLYGLPMLELTKEQFQNEILHQIYKSKSLDAMIKSSNNGKSLKTIPIDHFEVWHTWSFPGDNKHKLDKVKDKHKKWVNDIHNIKHQPTQKTSIPNLYLAGAHTKTDADLYSMEAAVESGRRVADLIKSSNTTLRQHIPVVISSIQKVDDAMYRARLPHVLDIFLLLMVISILIFVYASI